MALFFSNHAVGGNGRAGQAQHALHPGPGIGRAADDLQRFALSGVDGEHLQLVGIGVARGGEHMGDAEPCKPLCRVFDAFDLQPDGRSAHRRFQATVAFVSR